MKFEVRLVTLVFTPSSVVPSEGAVVVIELQTSF